MWDPRIMSSGRHKRPALPAFGSLLVATAVVAGCSGAPVVGTKLGSSGSPAQQAAQEPQTPATPSSEAAPESSEAAPESSEAAPQHAGIGQLLTFTVQGSDVSRFTLTVASLIDPAHPAISYIDDPGPGNREVGIELTIKNIGKTEVGIGNGQNYFSVDGSDGRNYEYDIGQHLTDCPPFPTDTADMGSFDIAAGQSVTACLPFAVPNGITVTKFVFDPLGNDNDDNSLGTWSLA